MLNKLKNDCKGPIGPPGTWSSGVFNILIRRNPWSITYECPAVATIAWFAFGNTSYFPNGR